MKVLKDNYKTTHINDSKNKIVCEHCKSELEYEESDVEIRDYGCAVIMCPLCGYKNFLDDCVHDINLTMHNVEFPTHFHHTSKENAVNCLNDEYVKDCIRKGINYFRNNKNENYWFTACGNTHIHVTRWEGDENYDVVVSGDYYNTCIPFEDEDYPYDGMDYL
jgi:hypothetical protein